MNELHFLREHVVCLICGVISCFYEMMDHVSSSHEFWWDQSTPYAYTNYLLMRNDVMIDQLILF
jgi:hypothetical protein